MSDFPTIVYKSPGKHRGPGGATYNFRPVGDAEALKAATQDGWSETMAEALGEKPAPKKRGRPPKAKTDDAD